jgi:hypothetical protein
MGHQFCETYAGCADDGREVSEEPTAARAASSIMLFVVLCSMKMFAEYTWRNSFLFAVA